jgi:hypothetical protein
MAWRQGQADAIPNAANWTNEVKREPLAGAGGSRYFSAKAAQRLSV